ncbi:DcrB-related protein [Ewingella sp. S1.OA.A_B6]
MNNRLICLEGTLDFEEEIRAQNINVVSFRQGQQITINRDKLLPGRTFAEHMTLQITNAEKIFNQFNFVKMDELNEGDLFSETILVIFNFVAGQGVGNKMWQVTFSSRLPKDNIITFTSVYTDEESMQREIGRLKHCVKHFVLNEK